jgi:hypothetical protein
MIHGDRRKNALDGAAFHPISAGGRSAGISADLAKKLKAEPVKYPIFPTDKSREP